MTPHIHISGMNALVITLNVIVALGIIKIVGRRFEHHPVGDALLSL